METNKSPNAVQARKAGAPLFTKRQIWSLLIPLMIEQVLNSLMGTADTMMVSNAGSAAISAVSLVDSINILLINVFAAMATSGTIICAQYLKCCKRFLTCTLNIAWECINRELECHLYSIQIVTLHTF